MLNGGKLRYITGSTASAGAGDTAVNLRPAAGKIWRILMARGAQDDGAVTVSWTMVDPDATGVIGGATAAAAWNSLYLGSCFENAHGFNPFSAPPEASYNRYFVFHFTASAAGKNGYVYAVVEEYSGVSSDV